METDKNLETQPLTDANRRQFERTKLIVEINYNGGDATGIASTRDIGMGGLYMVTQAELKEGSLLLMRMFFGEKELIISGVVAYSDPGQGVGVRFHGLADDAEIILKQELQFA
ncbi:MAG: PilZ domain-containing protein [Pyrinomonadaceae bacterium]|nr:PilZ domain-containing protein [Pyrinomonadaceae bacterium]